jgi:hypothetical protein
MKAAAAALVSCFLAGCLMTATRSQTCDRAAAVVIICTLARCDVPSVEGATAPESQTDCKKKTDNATD